ncbi:MAG: hypothetical protein RIS44_645 [Pseudomonadota bacterium]|jgi:hypothetical protein
MSSLWEVLLAAVVGNAVVVTALGYLAKALIENSLERDRVEFKARLERDAKDYQARLDVQSGHAIETVKSELQLRAIEFQILKSSLQERRASVIAEMNSHLAELTWSAGIFLSVARLGDGRTEGDRWNAVSESVASSHQFFDKHRPYFPLNVCDQIETLMLEIRKGVVGFGTWTKHDEDNLPEHARRLKHDAWKDGAEMIQQQVPALRRALENDFRILLGGEPIAPTSQNLAGAGSSST